MESSQQTSEEVFEIPKRRRLCHGLIAAAVLVVLCAGVFVAYAWDDLLYVFPSSLKESPVAESFTESVESQNPVRYVYETLNDSDKEKYQLVYTALAENSRIAFSTDNKNELRRIADCVQADYPEFADRSAVVMAEGGMFTPAYIGGVPLTSEDELAILDEQIAAATAECFAGLSDDADDYEKAKHVFVWLAQTVSYDRALESNQSRIVINASGNKSFTLDAGSSTPREHGQTISNALVDKRAVCAGYASAYQYLLQQLGIECAVVSGTAQQELHAWCLAKLDGEYYFIDPTWGDPEYTNNDASLAQASMPDFRFFAVTSSDIAATHIPDDTFELPDCTATADNYYVRENLFFDQADASRFGSLMFNSLSNGQNLSIRCASREVFDNLLHNWVETGEIGRLSLIEQYQYSSSDGAILTITLWPYVNSSGQAEA